MNLKSLRLRQTPPPAPPADPHAAFRIDHPQELLALLRRLRDEGTAVALSGPGGAMLAASVWTVDPDRGHLTLEVEKDGPHLPGLVEADEAIAQAWLDQVRLQFDLHDLVLVRGPRAVALQAALPGHLYRFQRRASFRVATAERSQPSATLRHPALPEMTLTLRVLDVSAGGCALRLPPDVPPLPLGSLVQGVQLALDADTRFAAALRLQHVTAIEPQAGGQRLGCELLQLSPDAQRTLQRYIDATQKRRRLLAQD